MTDAMPRLIVVFETEIDVGDGPDTVPIAVRTNFDLKQRKYVTSGWLYQHVDVPGKKTTPYADMKTTDAKSAFQNHARRLGELVMFLEAKGAEE